MAPSGTFLSEAARQRDLLPLPYLEDSYSHSPLQHLSRGCRQRIGKRRARSDRCQAAIDSINTLCCGEGAVPPDSCSGAQADAISQVTGVVLEQTPPPGLLAPDEALSQLLRSGGKYDASSGAHDLASAIPTGALAPLGSGELSLPADVSSAPRLVETLAEEEAQLFKGFRERLMLSTEDYNAKINSEGLPGLYYDPVLQRDRAKYVDLLIKMHCRGLLRWRASVSEQVGLFFVYKKNGSLRLIADARRTNARFIEPYPIELPSAEGCTRFIAPQDGAPSYGAGLDLKD